MSCKDVGVYDEIENGVRHGCVVLVVSLNIHSDVRLHRHFHEGDRSDLHIDLLALPQPTKLSEDPLD